MNENRTSPLTVVIAVFLIGFLVLCCVGLWNSENAKPSPEALFKRLDSNGDGKISKEEFAKFAEVMKEKAKDKGKGKNANGKGAEAIFNRLDSNGDGYLSLDEFKKLSEMRHKKKDK